MSALRALLSYRRRPMSDFQELLEWDWADSYAWTLLHAVRETDWETAAREWMGGPALLECGRRVKGFVIPGMGTRMTAPRCPRCCDALGYPHGVGSPKNDDRCRPLVEARLTAKGGPTP